MKQVLHAPLAGHARLGGLIPLDLSCPKIMGIVNVTPDSFSDGGRYLAHDAAIAHGRQLAQAGAAILDVGGESTRPGAKPVDPEEELKRVLPVVTALVEEGYYVSIDTRHASVMRACIEVGVAMVNDVEALRGRESRATCRDSEVAICLMHMQGTPDTMQINPQYADVLQEVSLFLEGRVAEAQTAGIARDRLVIDPGFGFGKTVEHNLALLKGLPRLCALGLPVLAGLSRKSVLGAVTGKSEDDRVYASVAAALLAVVQGARIVRVHDVAATENALAVWSALEGFA